MDPLMKLWLYEGWANKIHRELERDRYLGILIGSFTNPEAAQKMMKPPIETTDDEFEQSWQMVEENRKKVQEVEKTDGKKRRRRRLIKNG